MLFQTKYIDSVIRRIMFSTIYILITDALTEPILYKLGYS